MFVPVFAANVVMVVAILAVLFTINVKLTLLSLISFPLLAVGAAWFQRLLGPVATRLQERLADVSEVVEEGVAGIRVLKGFGAEQVQKDRLDDRAEQVRREAVALGRLRATFNPMLDLLPMVALVTVLYVGGQGRDRRHPHRRRHGRVQLPAAAARVPAAHDVVHRGAVLPRDRRRPRACRK